MVKRGGNERRTARYDSFKRATSKNENIGKTYL